MHRVCVPIRSSGELFSNRVEREGYIPKHGNVEGAGNPYLYGRCPSTWEIRGVSRVLSLPLTVRGDLAAAGVEVGFMCE